jgi:hypothetical protein
MRTEGVSIVSNPKDALLKDQLAGASAYGAKEQDVKEREVVMSVYWRNEPGYTAAHNATEAF